MTNQPQGRLELTWANKELRLLAHADETYEWVDPSDWRVSETRLLRETATVGEPSDNLLIQGDALHALRALSRVPELRARYQGKVRLCYIDPPFNTGQAFAHYDDALENSVWLTMLRDRLAQIRDLLSPDGSVWLHLDDAQQHRGRAVLDEVFGAEAFVATVIWERTDLPSMAAGKFTMKNDFIHIYARTDAFRPNGFAWEGGVPAHYDRIDEENGRAYCIRTLRRTGPGAHRADRPTMWFPIAAPDGTQVWPMRPDGTEGRWLWGPDRVATDAGQIDWQQRADGTWEPYYRIYADPETIRPPDTLWRYTDVGSNRVAKSELRRLFPGIPLFETPKPERLMERIIHIATNPGDLVLDCFAGSGTTAAVAHKMGRRWIAVELRGATIDTFARPRLEQVVAGSDLGGITNDVGWEGGGGFTFSEVGPSMFEDIGGVIVLAEWAAGGGALAEAVAAQVGYTLEAGPPFVGRRGRSRLAVIDGVLSEDVARFLVGRLEERETVLIVAQAIEEGVADLVRALRPGSRVRKVPRDLARTSRMVGPIVTLGTTEPTGQARMPL